MGRKGYRPRRENIKKSLKSIVIVCEGEKTETQYFHGFKKRNSGVNIVPLHGKCTDPKSIVDFAKEQIGKKDLNFDEGDSLWCVFDVDENTDEMIDRAVKLANKHNIQIALSNPCIEFWFLLHYDGTYNPTLTRDEACNKLKDHINNYDKSYPKIYSVLKDKLPTAIKNAKKLNKTHENESIQLLSTKSVPSSQVFKLVESIQELIEKNKIR